MELSISQNENAIASRGRNPAYDEWAKRDNSAKAVESNRATQLIFRVVSIISSQRHLSRSYQDLHKLLHQERRIEQGKRS